MKSFVALGLLCIAVVHAAHFEVPLNNLRIVRSAHVFAPSIGGVGASGSQSNAQSFSQSQNFNQGIGGLPFGGTSGLSISSSSSNANSQSFNNGFNQGIGGYPGLGGFIPQIGGFGYGK